jgi:hypothetical protein
MVIVFPLQICPLLPNYSFVQDEWRLAVIVLGLLWLSTPWRGWTISALSDADATIRMCAYPLTFLIVIHQSELPLISKFLTGRQRVSVESRFLNSRPVNILGLCYI